MMAFISVSWQPNPVNFNDLKLVVGKTCAKGIKVPLSEAARVDKCNDRKADEVVLAWIQSTMHDTSLGRKFSKDRRTSLSKFHKGWGLQNLSTSMHAGKDCLDWIEH